MLELAVKVYCLAAASYRLLGKNGWKNVRLFCGFKPSKYKHCEKKIDKEGTVQALQNLFLGFV